MNRESADLYEFILPAFDGRGVCNLTGRRRLTNRDSGTLPIDLTAECLNQVRISTLSVRPTIPMTTISRQHRAHTSVNSFCLLLSILSEATAQAPIPGDSFTGTVQKLEAVGSKIQMRDVNCIASVFEEHPPIVRTCCPS